MFGFEPHFGCCTANLHQGWPKFVRSMWMQAADGALTAVAYGPCQVRADVDGRPVRLEVVTDYPFGESVRIVLGLNEPTELTLRLRIPGWCEDAVVEVDGDRLPGTADADGYLRVTRIWYDADVVELSFPMTLRTVPRDRGAAASGSARS